MFEKQKQHIRILTQIRKIRKKRDSFKKGSPEYARFENKYLHDRERYFDVLISNYKKGKHLGYGFILKQAAWGVAGLVIKRVVQIIVPPLCVCLGFQYFEKPKSTKNPCDPVELQTLRNDTNSLRNEIMALKEQIRRDKVMHEASRQLMKDVTVQKSAYFRQEKRNETVVPKMQELNKNEQPCMKSETAPDKYDLEFKPNGEGITRIGYNRFAWKFSSRNSSRAG